jgi:hypothetical protein
MTQQQLLLLLLLHTPKALRSCYVQCQLSPSFNTCHLPNGKPLTSFFFCGERTMLSHALLTATQ